MSKFEAGDRVRVKNDSWYSTLVGKEATVLAPHESPDGNRAHPNETVKLDFGAQEYREWYVDPSTLELSIPQNGGGFLPTEASERKKIPIATGVLDYFPAALAEVAKVSYAGNQQHNPGEPLHWARNKSTDQDDTIIRHFLERGTVDKDGMRHSAKLAWRVLAMLQLELEAEGAPIARGAKTD